MRLTLILLYLVIRMGTVLAQKPVVDLNAIANWQSVQGANISPDGHYVSYGITTPSGNKSLLITNSTGNWKRTVAGCSDAVFSSDSKKLLCQKKDTLVIVTLGQNDLRNISRINLFKTPENRIDWIGYTLNNGKNEFKLEQLSTKKAFVFKDVEDFQFNGSGIILTMVRNIGGRRFFDFLSLNDMKTRQIWESSSSNENIGRILFNKKNQLAFTVMDDSINSVWAYQLSNKKAVEIIGKYSNQLNSKDGISYEPNFFSVDGSRLFLKGQKAKKHLPKIAELASVDIYNYKDELTQDMQMNLPLTKNIDLVYHMQSGKLIELNEDINTIKTSNSEHIKGEYTLSTRVSYLDDYYWNNRFSFSCDLISTLDGKRTSIIKDGSEPFNVMLSPSEKYVIWYNTTSNRYFSFDIASAKIRDISSSIPFPLFDDEKAAPTKRAPFGILGWLQNDEHLLIYDRYDIWSLDPLGIAKPINLTKGYGRKHASTLGIATGDPEKSAVFEKGSNLILAGFNRYTKENSLLTFTLDYRSAPKLRHQSSKYYYCIPRTVPYLKGTGSPSGDRINPGYIVKAKEANIYLVPRMSSTESLNFLLTKDLTRYTQISKVLPERKFNWLSSELVKFPMLNGQFSQGILYKPENFDSSKKYPVIFNYYEEKSDELNMYIKPSLSNSIINIPYYVSNGYLVFVPDIFYEKGELGKGILNSVEGAAQHLSKFTWVDTTKMGVNGQSFGGYETYFLTTHSNLFAAACGGSGTSNLTNSYGELSGYGSPRYALYDVDQSYFGITPWENPELYMKNSPIFGIDKVTTPLLIWHSKDDHAVPFEQAIQMYMGLRRANKRVWLLQYDGGGHGLSGKNARDFTIRLKQFFDFYLMRANAPKWMTVGVPYEYKQVVSGFEQDSTGVIP